MSDKADTWAALRSAAVQSWSSKVNAPLLITVGTGTCGLAAGAQETLAAACP